MKKLTIYLQFFIASFLMLTACGKDDTTPTEIPTSLELTIKDHLGNIVNGANVKLFASESDWNNETNQIGSTQVSDASGKVKFTNLSAIKYYWFAEKNCENNVNGAVTTVDPLSANKTNTLDVILSQTGNLKLNNTSDNPYRIFYDGQVVIESMNGNSTQTFYFVPTGNHSIRYLQLSGYAVYPTDETESINVSCGATTALTFP
jgi:hypothetical protein